MNSSPSATIYLFLIIEAFIAMTLFLLSSAMLFQLGDTEFLLLPWGLAATSGNLLALHVTLRSRISWLLFFTLATLSYAVVCSVQAYLSRGIDFIDIAAIALLIFGLICLLKTSLLATAEERESAGITSFSEQP